MKIWALGAVVASTLVLVACGGKGNGTTLGTGGAGTGGTATTGSHTTVTTGSHTTSTTATGPGSGGSGTGGGAQCGINWDSMNMPCNQCMLDNCCDQLNACGAGTMCGDFLTCANACAMGDKACVQGCQNSNMQGLMDYQTLITCYDKNCSVTKECGTQICMSGVIVGDKNCGDCLTTSCCDAWTACSGDMTCAKCIGAMPSPACMANALYTAAISCQDGATCGPVCATTICDTMLGYPGAAACNYCLGKKDAMMGCCEEMEACTADMAPGGCFQCITGAASGAMCMANAKLTAFNTCRTNNCMMACGG